MKSIRDLIMELSQTDRYYEWTLYILNTAEGYNDAMNDCFAVGNVDEGCRYADMVYHRLKALEELHPDDWLTPHLQQLSSELEMET